MCELRSSYRNVCQDCVLDAQVKQQTNHSSLAMTYNLIIRLITNPHLLSAYMIVTYIDYIDHSTYQTSVAHTTRVAYHTANGKPHNSRLPRNAWRTKAIKCWVHVGVSQLGVQIVRRRVSSRTYFPIKTVSYRAAYRDDMRAKCGRNDSKMKATQMTADASAATTWRLSGAVQRNLFVMERH